MVSGPLAMALEMHRVQYERANRIEADLVEILLYVYKRSKQGDPEADQLLAKYGHYTF